MFAKAKAPLQSWSASLATFGDGSCSVQELEDQLSSLRMELELAQDVAQRASSTWDKFKKERDFHRMHHKRVAQEKNKLITDIKQLKAHFAKYEPTILELKRKYETAMKEKMLANLERDKMAAKVSSKPVQLLTDELIPMQILVGC
jgi:chromosome segregation ATPase